MARQYNSDGTCRECGFDVRDHTRNKHASLWERAHCPDASLPQDPKEDDPWDPKYQLEAPVSELFDPIE